MGHKDRDHDLLSASSFKRIMECPASVKLAQAMPELKDSVHASAGTDSHELAEECLTLALTKGEKPLTKRLEEIRADDPDTATDILGYIAFVSELEKAFKSGCDGEELKQVRRFVEKRFSLTKHVGGTADYVLAGMRNGRLEICVVDYKSGYERVGAEDNPQLVIYGLAVAALMSAPLRTLRLYIYQPSDASHPTKKTTLDEHDIIIWTARINMAEKKALDILRDDTYPVLESLKPGEWCKYCRAKPTCPALHAIHDDVSLALTGSSITQIPIPKLVDIFQNEAQLIELIRSVGVYLKRLAEAGVTVPNTKLVTSKGKRSWSLAEDALASTLKARGIRNPYNKRIIGIGEAEKALGKGSIDDIVLAPPVYTKLVPVHDEREAIESNNLIEEIPYDKKS